MFLFRHLFAVNSGATPDALRTSTETLTHDIQITYTHTRRDESALKRLASLLGSLFFAVL